MSEIIFEKTIGETVFHGRKKGICGSILKTEETSALSQTSKL